MSRRNIELDFNNLLEFGFEQLAGRAENAVRNVERLHRAGELGFIDLPDQNCRQIESLARHIAKRFDNLVVLGIGGSALSNTALHAALARKSHPRLFVADNSDPTMLAEILAQCDLRKTIFNVISKSGSTVETAAQFLICWGKVLQAVGKKRARQHFVITTDPQKGCLRAIADAEAIRSLPVLPNVGGRFTALSAVGLLSSAATGVRIRELLAGAARARAACRSSRLFENPALTAATALYWLDTARGRKIHVLMPYAHRLRYVSDWFAQLWAESLGKKLDRAGRCVHVGPTPVKALGATDQHSQLQLYIEGPQDKVVIFLTVEDLGTRGRIPRYFADQDDLGYLGGQSLAELLRAEQRGTELALSRNGRPNYTIRLPRVDERSIGALLFLLEMQTAYAGELYNINAFDQPAVELGKHYAFGILGRQGYEQFATEAGRVRRDRRRIVSF